MEAMLQAYDNTVNAWSGKNRGIGDLKIPDMKFSQKIFENKKSLDEYISHADYGKLERPAVCFGFQMKVTRRKKYELELFFNDAAVLDYKSIPSQDENAVNESDSLPVFRQYVYYSFHGFAYIQNWAANTILRHLTRRKDAVIAAMTIPMDVPFFVADPFVGIMYFSLKWFVMLMFIPLVYRVTYRMVKEKELRTKEIMSMMGMSASSYWLSWLFYFTCINTLMSLCAWSILCFGCMRYTSGPVIFLMLWLYGQAIFGYIMLCQSFFLHAKTAAVVTTMIYFGSGISLQLPEFAPYWKRILFSIMPTGCMNNTVKVITGFELNGMGINMQTLHRDYRNYNALVGFQTFILSFIVMNAIGLYLERVIPKEYGRTDPICFCCMSKYWCSSKRSKAFKRRIGTQQKFLPQDVVSRNEKFETQFMNKECYETLSPWVAQYEETNRYLKIENLVKEYNSTTACGASKKFKAVDQINVKMYADQIFVLLGHNGAGKSSAISVLSGLYEPTRGKATVFGVDMFEEADTLRQFLGICPQHDILFDLLTTQEHMEIFYDFKCPDPNPVKKALEIEKLLTDVGIDDKRTDLASKLSGGSQRKLSCALALCGGSKLIIMDEPTSSLDLTARRKVWNMLKEYKKDRIILLTTHYMDEADILGDRIGIMVRGKITTLGTSLFMKQKFGTGYHLIVQKTNTEPNKEIFHYVRERLGTEVMQMSDIQTEVTIQIPGDQTDKFKAFFEDFDRDMEMLKVSSYGVSLATLEDVFLRIGHVHDPMTIINPIDQRTPDTRGEPRTGGKVSDSDHTVNLIGSPYRKPTKKGNRDSIMSGPSEAPEDDVSLSRKFSHSSKYNDIDTYNNNYSNNSRQKKTDIDRTYSPQNSNINDSIQHDRPSPTSNVMMVKKRKSVRSPVKKVPRAVEEFSLSETDADSTFAANFNAIFYKRFLLYQSWKSLVYEIIAPIFIIVVGTGLTSIDLFERTESRVLYPDRIYDEPGKQLLLINKKVSLDNNRTLDGEDFAKRLTGKEYFDIRYVNNSMNFEEFGDYQVAYGRASKGTFPYMYGAYQFYEANLTTHQYKFYSFMNMTCTDCPVLYPQFMYDSILKVATGDDEVSFTTRNTPYPITNAVIQRKVRGNALSVIFITGVALSMICSSVIGHVVQERVEGYKHMQLISGMNLSAYWFANFCVDFIKMEAVMVSAVIAFFVFEMKYFSAWVTYLLFPIAWIPMSYVMSFMFSSLSSAQTFAMGYNFGFIVFGSIIVHSIRWIKEWEVIGDSIRYLFRAVPPFTMGNNIYFDTDGEDMVAFREATSGNGAGISDDPWLLENTMGDGLSLLMHLGIWSLCLVIIELGFMKSLNTLYIACFKVTFPKPDANLVMEEDVVGEEKRVGKIWDADLQIKVNKMRKVYLSDGGFCQPPKALRAVEKLSFGLKKGECFALLGVNGAGKSTTFKTLVAEEEPTSGRVTIQGINIDSDFNTARKLLGYCPQFNPGFNSLTVEQNLRFFATLKGIPGRIVPDLLNKVIDQLDLQPHRFKAMSALSGGNKRKLSVGIAIIGNPPIILLDEPSAGMDPEARRFMWQIVKKISVQKSSAVLLTSHLMEEAEFLCTKMGIMVKGGIFKCFGTPQHIKDKFGVGFEVEIKIGVPDQETLVSIVQSELSDCLVPESNQEKNPDNPNSNDVQLYIKGTLTKLMREKKIDILVANKIKSELLITYKYSNETNLNIHLLQDELDVNYQHADEDSEVTDAKCSALVMAEKLFTQRNVYGSIFAICKDFDSLELLEQYGNYFKVRVPRNKKTIGQMFGMIVDIKKAHSIDQYSVNQTTLEQIFNSFANLTWDEDVKTFLLSENGWTLNCKEGQRYDKFDAMKMGYNVDEPMRNEEDNVESRDVL